MLETEAVREAIQVDMALVKNEEIRLNKLWSHIFSRFVGKRTVSELTNG